ncbi:MAG: metallophosphoesterase [Akkermansiaceae bacterium]|nr:metallophosphoesterase [Akkermansiaceae bacterium]
MASTIRWLHLSDFHVGKDDYAGYKMFDYIIAHVKQRKDEGFTPDFIFVTGDLANKGLESEYTDFWLGFMDVLQDAVGNDIVGRTFVVPGNHDVDRDLNQAFGRDEMLAASSKHFDPTERGLKARQMLIPRFQAFDSSDQTLAKGAFTSMAGAFSSVLTLRDKKVGIAGINTAWLCKDEHDDGKLTPGKGMVEQALNAIKDAHLRIVLGHHPLDWLLPAEQKSIKSLFGQNGVIYLHGHLHDEWAEPTYGGGHQFLAIQSGAAFQAREREKWRNGLVWGEADLDTTEIRLQPRRWISDQQSWVPATDAFHEYHRSGDWWHYPMPGSEPAKKLGKIEQRPPTSTPKGWAVSKASELALHLKPLETEAAVRFFNGAAPSWATALSTSIPRRKIVGSLASRFQDAEAAGRPLVAVLLAAGCEGKTTAMLQAAGQIVEGKPDWRILRRIDDAEPFLPDDILPELIKEYHWLVVIDEADRAAKSITEFLPRLSRELDGRVHFLLACRDSDWLGSRADDLRWSDVSIFQKERLAGLDADDAKAIVTAWGDFGNAGLGDMVSVDEGKRAEVLANQAREEAKTQKGALFGALLAVRHGSDLPNHARLMLDRLRQRSIPGGCTLHEALAYVAAMHAEGLEFLSRPVLAQVLACPLSRLHREVLTPLGQEAAATSTSSFIFTRHRRIAQALVEVLEKEFGVDVGDLFVALAVAAIDAAKDGHYVTDLSEWRFKFARYFLDAGKEELAIKIGKAVLSRESTDFRQISNLSSLYRQTGATEEAVGLFRSRPASMSMDRGSYFEWGTAEGLNGDAVGSVILIGFSLSDDCSSSWVDNNRAKLGLAGLGVALGELFENYRASVFRDARVGVAVLGQQLELDTTTAAHFRKHIDEGKKVGAVVPTVDEAFTLFRKSVAAAESIGVNEFVDAIVPDAAHLDFEGLKRLVYAAAESRHRC